MKKNENPESFERPKEEVDSLFQGNDRRGAWE
jgi:hypothetical protein